MNKNLKNAHAQVELLISRVALILFAILYTDYGFATEPDNAMPKSYARNIVEFDKDLLMLGAHSKVDLSRFSYDANASPGKYNVNVYLNNDLLSNEEIQFREGEEHQVFPCLTSHILSLINFKAEQLPARVRDALVTPGECTDIKVLIPDANVDFDSNKQELHIEIPQLYLNRVAQGTVNPALWDSGIPALTLGYYINGYDSQYSHGNSSRSLFSSLNAGLNIGEWYIRHNGSYNWQEKGHGEYSTLNSYVQRDITALRGQLIAGQYNTSGQQFNSLSFSGVQIKTDDRILPESQRGYAPEIRGVAKTNAKVTVRQQNMVIYETTVSPGAFLINDLYPMGYGGDLQVTVQEADGAVTSYTVPYSSVAQLLRPGMQQFSMTAGKLRNTGVSNEPVFAEGTWTRGLSNIFTGFTGAQVSENYKAVNIGLAMGTNLGAFSADVTHSDTSLKAQDEEKITGQSYRLSYSKLISETDSNITLAAYRYSSSGYMDFLTAMQTQDALTNNADPDRIKRSKNRFTVNINQGLPSGWGNFYASASLEKYWNDEENYDKQYQVGYSNNYKRISYSLNISRTRTDDGKNQTNWFLNFTLPLWESRETRSPYLSLRYNQDDNGGKGEQALISGGFGENNKYNYNISASHDNSSGSSGSFGASWQGRAASVNGSYSTGRDYHSTSLGMNGTLIAHKGGITLTPFNSDTYALIEAKGASGATVAGYAGAVVDQNGYALFPSLTPYKMNKIAIDPAGSPLNVEFENTSLDVAPRAGAVVKVKFKTRKGIPILITSSFGGGVIPFGADVFDEKNNYIGAVAQGGMIYARVSEEKGTLQVKWGDDLNSRCYVSYQTVPGRGEGDNTWLPQQFNSPCLSRAIEGTGKNATAVARNN